MRLFSAVLLLSLLGNGEKITREKLKQEAKVKCMPLRIQTLTTVCNRRAVKEDINLTKICKASSKAQFLQCVRSVVQDTVREFNSAKKLAKQQKQAKQVKKSENQKIKQRTELAEQLRMTRLAE